MDAVGVLAVGLGRMGKIHAENVARNNELKLLYVCSKTEEGGQKFAHHLNKKLKLSGDSEIKWTSDYLAALKDPKVGAVVICSPTQLHKEQIIQALENGKNVFCEKPIALTIEDIDQCYETAEKTGKTLFCAYQRRFDPHIASIKAAIDSGAIGKVELLRLTSRDHPPPPQSYLDAPSSGSFFDDFSTHDADTARFLVGEDPVEVYAVASAFLPGTEKKENPGDDTAAIAMRFPSGALCLIENFRQTSYGYDVRVEILGSNGSMLKLENPHNAGHIHYTPSRVSNTTFKYSFPERFDEAYKNELQHFVDVIHGRAKCSVSGKDARAAAQLTSQAQQSRAGQAKLARLENRYNYPEITPVDGKVGVAIVGGGRMGQVRALTIFLNKNASLKYILDVDSNLLKSLEEQFGCKTAHTDKYDEILEDPEVHAIIISTPSRFHAPFIKKAVAKKKHVFCEKPLALSLEDTKDCVRAAIENKVHLYTGYHRRSDPHFIDLKQSISGKIETVSITSREPGGHSTVEYLISSGGFLYDSVIHDIDMCRYLVGEEPTEVFCVGTANNQTAKTAGDVDAIILILRFPSGVIATLDNHRKADYGYDQRAEVHTSTGMFQCANQNNALVVSSDENGIHYRNPVEGMKRYADAYNNETNHFVDVVRGVAKPRVTYIDPIAGSAIAEAGKKSMATGKPQIIDSL